MDIHVGGIRIRADALTPEQGRQLGDRVGALLSERLATGTMPAQDLGLVRARIERNSAEPIETLARRIVQAIVDGIPV